MCSQTQVPDRLDDLDRRNARRVGLFGQWLVVGQVDVYRQSGHALHIGTRNNQFTGTFIFPLSLVDALLQLGVALEVVLDSAS